MLSSLQYRRSSHYINSLQPQAHARMAWPGPPCHSTTGHHAASSCPSKQPQPITTLLDHCSPGPVFALFAPHCAEMEKLQAELAALRAELQSLKDIRDDLRNVATLSHSFNSMTESYDDIRRLLAPGRGDRSLRALSSHCRADFMLRTWCFECWSSCVAGWRFRACANDETNLVCCAVANCRCKC